MKLQRICFILGSNLGNREKNLSAAIEMLEKAFNLKNIRESKLLENKALLKPNSPKSWDVDFLNIAISADIDINIFTIDQILTQIHRIEDLLGRKRQGKNWQPREIDIDIAAISDLVIDDDHIKIPHQELLNRHFFLSTMNQVEPNWRFPVTGEYLDKTISEILAIKDFNN